MTLLLSLFSLFTLSFFFQAGPPTAAAGMDASAIASVTIPVVALTQISKWSGLPNNRGPLVVLLLSALGVVVWAFSEGRLTSGNAFSLLTGFALIATSAAGVFGFTRSMPAAVTATSQPPAGAGANRTN